MAARRSHCDGRYSCVHSRCAAVCCSRRLAITSKTPIVHARSIALAHRRLPLDRFEFPHKRSAHHGRIRQAVFRDVRKHVVVRAVSGAISGQQQVTQEVEQCSRQPTHIHQPPAARCRSRRRSIRASHPGRQGRVAQVAQDARFRRAYRHTRSKCSSSIDSSSSSHTNCQAVCSFARGPTATATATATATTWARRQKSVLHQPQSQADPAHQVVLALPAAVPAR